MIILKELRWDNCFSYGPGNTIRLDENSITQIVGPNGAGKSSIPLIIEEIIHNKNSKGLKKADIPNRALGGDYKIELDFSVGDNEYNLSVIRKSTIKVSLKENGVDISSHTATGTFKTVSDLIGMDFKTMSQLFYQSTKESLQFLTATDTNRKKFLIDLLHLEEYVELFEIFKDAVKTASVSLASLEGEITTIQNWLATNKLEATDILPLLKIDIETGEDEIALSKITSELSNILDKNKRISRNEDNKIALAKINIAENSEIDAHEKMSYDEHQSKMGEAEGRFKVVKAHVEKLQKLGDECPTCEQPISTEFKSSLIDSGKKELDELAETVSRLSFEISVIQQNNKTYDKKQQVQRQWEELFRSIDKTLPAELLDKADLEKRSAELKARIMDAKKRVQEMMDENSRRDKANTRVQVIQEQTIEFQKKLQDASEKLNAQGDIVGKLEILKKAFSTNGLIAYKIENLVKELEDQTNHYLAELSDGRFTIEFVVSNDKLNVEVTDTGRTVDILALSSGELARVNTATLLALRKLMSVISKSELNVLFLDEVINVLDEQGKEKLIEVLLGENLNTFIVSHNWTHPLLTKLEVVKDENGISYIER